jgi:hypothetical protein
MRTPFARKLSSSIILLGLSACGSSSAFSTTTTTSGAVAKGSPGLVLGDSCVRSEACESGFCDHPIGFCDAPGVCREKLSCDQWSLLYGPTVRATRDGRCVANGRSVEIPSACVPRVTPEGALRLRRISTVEIVPDDDR